MGVLQYPTALATVQDALVSVIRLALGTRDTVADLTALAAIPSRTGSTNSILDGRLAYVTSAATVYRFSQYSTATANGSSTVAPSDAGSNAGRWLIASSEIETATGTAISSVAIGYLRRVILWAGERSDKIWKVRILGQRPAVVLQFSGETKTIRANQRGALTEKTYHFALWGVSQNLRPDLEGEKGSPISAESTADPGVARIMGDLEYLLDGLRGEDLGVDGLDYLMFGAVEPGIQDYDGREFVWTAPLDVRVTIGKEDPPTRSGLALLIAQPVDVQLHGQASLDDNNYVAFGLGVSTGAGFTKTPADGIAYIAGSQVTVSGLPHTFTASRATYRDLLPDGTWTYVETWSDDTAPAVTPGAMRIAVTFTDFSGVTEDRFLVATKENAGPATEIPLGNGVPDNRVYFGVASDPGSPYSQAFVETTIGGQGNDIATMRQRTIVFNAGAGQYLWYCFPSSYGGAASNFIDANTGFASGFQIAGTVDRQEDSGAVVTYTLWRSEQSGLGAVTISVT